ncbi:permease [Curvibacter sp. HBC61]|uniref:Permease n=1 Tax=Curvibacter cyanobacteriorum TaxID=3026422 RepID=A0ABT5MYS5_9BURK|nr:permease [Curvibacter sp. HBC61]MDD0838982.1 permease [Curvibacter sp. HBC61]
MQPRVAKEGSMIAQLQRGLLAVIWGLAALALWGLWSRSPALAVGVAWAVLALNAGVLGLEFLLAAWHNRREPVPRAGALVLLQAWWGEAVAATRVFGHWQPFAAGAVPDQVAPGRHPGLRPVLLLHGYVCNRGFWTPWLQAFRAEGRPFMALTLEPPFASIDAQADAVGAAVRTLTEATGRAPVVLAHSMGGLVLRAWWRAHSARGLPDAVHHAITLGTPHHGTWLARWAHTANVRQMRLGSDWLRALAQGEPAERAARFTCVHSNTDNVVFPAGTATLAGARNVLVRGLGHVALACDDRLRAEVMGWIAATDEAPAPTSRAEA